MTSGSSGSGDLRFGPFRLDTRTGELRREGAGVSLPPQPARVLALLASRPGELVTREEIRREIWGADTFVEFDQGLNFCIRRIRAALGEAAASPRYIETLPRRGYRFIAPVEKLAAAAPPGRTMLVVLPFENLDPDPEQGYFSDGLTEEMITQLGRLDPPRLGVIARTSSMRYKGSDRGVDEIGRELGVAYVLEGSVRRSGDRVRITAQLLQASDQTHLWAETYDRPLRDILAVQAEVAQAIARETRLTLTPQERSRLEQMRYVVPEAYQAYLHGLFSYNQDTQEGCKRSLACLRQAVEADPGSAPAHAALSLTYARMRFHEYMAPREATRQARAAALRAIEIDEECADGHAALARVELEIAWDWMGAEKECSRAIELNPSHVAAHHWFSHLHVALGRMEESRVASQRAVELDPLDLYVNAHLAWHYIHARLYGEAIGQSRRTVEMEPSYVLARIYFGWALLHAGRRAKAVSELEEAVRMSRGENNEALCTLGHAYAVGGRKARAREVLDQLLNRRDRFPFGRAVIFAALGKADDAFRLLEEALSERSGHLIYLKTDPRLDSIRSDPRFGEIVRRIGLPD